MTRLPLQSTRFNGLQQLIGKQLLGWVTSGWLQKSLGLISLLGGAYLAANITSIYLNFVHLQSLGALGMLILVEIMVRLRTRLAGTDPGLLWTVLDNFRIGAVYSLVLEGFKLGS